MNKFARSFATWRQTRNTIAQLSRLSERELEDVGFTRGDIVDVARRSVRQG